MTAPLDGFAEETGTENGGLGVFVACVGRRTTLRVGRALTNAETLTERRASE